MVHSGVKKIKPCPFCGGRAVPKARRVDTAYCKGVIAVFIECTNCRAKGAAVDDFHNNNCKSSLRNLAIESWNRRVRED